MTSERYSRIGELYHQLLARPVEQRAAFLAEVCGDDDSLREEVLSLLAANEAAASFIETPAIAAAAASLAADHRPIAPGARIGPYEVRALLGRGGMGEVYRAHDPRLGRDVALKLLPERFTLEAQRLARFEREARLLAAVNHPNIAALYGIETSNGQRVLVLELVQGSTLDARVTSGPMPWPDVLPIAQQIVEALEAAHEQGIIHRDLKPANIVIRPDGVVKVLDFGLAKALDPNLSSDTTAKVTALTEAQTVIGTAPYMSPEQARGRAGDQRIDIWAFGCILYEMLTGRRAFDGDGVAEVLAGVLHHDPDWTRIPSDVPPALQRLLRLCLEKDPRRRRQSSGDVRIDLEQVQAQPVASAPAVHARGSRFATRATLGVAIVTTVALAFLAVIHFREAALPEVRLQLVTPATRQPLDFALSPDGRHIVFVGSESLDGVDRLYLRPLGQDAAQPMAGTDGARLPFWSPDSRSVGFFAAGRLYRVDIAGGALQALAAAANPVGGAWSSNGTILFAPDTVSPLFRVAASGGETVAATRLDAPRQTNHRHPSFLPDGQQFLFTSGGSDPDQAGLYLGSLDGRAPKRLTQAGSGGAYLAPDRVLFLLQGALVARRFDAARGLLVGDPVTLATSVAWFSASATGIVAHRAGGLPRLRTAWFDRQGNLVKELRAVMNGPELSPDGRHVAGDRTIGGNRDIWLLDLVRDGLTRMTTHPAVDGFPLWSPDSSRLAFHSARNGTIDLWIKPSSGADAEELLLEQPESEWPIHWSKDGRFLLYQRADLVRGSWDLWALPMTGADRTPFAVANTPFIERLGEFSPDGRWIAYDTNESGRSEIVVQSFPEPGGRLAVSTGGGAAPRWSADATEIYFLAPDGRMMAVPVHAKASTLEFGTPAALFATHIAAQTFKFQYMVSREVRFLINSVLETTAPPIVIILNAKPD